MSKYEPLWNYLKKNNKDNYKLSYEEIKNILGFDIDHSFCIFLIIGVVIRLGVYYFKYDNTNNSAPFYDFIIERIVEFIVPKPNVSKKCRAK